MAGDWIKMRVDLDNDPAVIAMADALGIHETHVVGLLHKTWAWADGNARPVFVRDLSAIGHAPGVTLSWLDRYLGVNGFAQSMVSVGWLLADDGLKFPHFDRHNGESAKKRAMDTDRKRLARSPQIVRNLSANEADKNRTREEKRREDIKPPAIAAPPQAKKARKTEVPPDFEISDPVRKWANEKGHGQYLDLHLEAFIRKCAANGYAYADHDAAFMEAVRENWAKIGPASARGNGNGGHQGPPAPDPNAGSILCETCGTRTRQFTGRQCDPCWRKPPAVRASA